LSLVFKVLKVTDFFSRQRRQQAKAIPCIHSNYRQQQETTTVTGKKTGQGLGCKQYHTTLFIPSQSPIHTPVHYLQITTWKQTAKS
jgi:hypothetical protein